MFLLSLPMRERGLKYQDDIPFLIADESLPMRERGLKCIVIINANSITSRSPCGSVD